MRKFSGQVACGIKQQKDKKQTFTIKPQEKIQNNLTYKFYFKLTQQSNMFVACSCTPFPREKH